jgi:hypothetical protein
MMPAHDISSIISGPETLRWNFRLDRSASSALSLIEHDQLSGGVSLTIMRINEAMNIPMKVDTFDGL